MLRLVKRTEESNNDSNTHGHCDNCFSRNCTTPGCPLADCIDGCGTVAHQCKMEDHENVCLNKQVPCINVIYGCEVSLPRHKIKVHLEHCSASVVVCKFAWERVDRNILGNISSEDLFADGSREKKAEKFVEDFFHSDMERIKESLGVEERSKEMSSLIQPYPHTECNYITDPDKLFHMLNKIHGKIEYSYFYDPNAHCVTAKSRVVSLSSSLCCFYVTVDQCRQQLHIVLRCNETVRRDEFENHYKTQHSIIHCELGGWLVHHCPLYEYGCNFSISRLQPTPAEYKLIYNKHVHKFVITEKECLIAESENSETAQGLYAARLQQQRELAAYGYSDIPVDPISQLPTEVLHIIINYLDSSGLFCLSMTS
ncbi:uncharacterized protein [Dysidea avara]|uniref:uncharacterized protein n=1 Tax=Dysidea avara TaxID=196820 RepID=UPI0033206719